MDNALVEALAQPTVLAAIVAGLVTLLAPRISAAIKRRENGNVASVAVRVRQLDASQQMLDRLTDEIALLQERLRGLEARERRLHDTLVLVEGEVALLRERLESSGATDLALRAVQVLEMVRRGRGVA